MATTTGAGFRASGVAAGLAVTVGAGVFVGLGVTVGVAVVVGLAAAGPGPPPPVLPELAGPAAPPVEQVLAAPGVMVSVLPSDTLGSLQFTVICDELEPQVTSGPAQALPETVKELLSADVS